MALYLKEVLAVRSFERWKSRQTLIGVYRRYQAPIFLAADELAGRVYGLARHDNDREIQEIQISILEKDFDRPAHCMVGDHYFQYRFVSNVYRFCSFLGWIELYRRDIGTLDVDSLDRNRLLESCLGNVRSALADGWVNQHDDIKDWRDCLFFREELRAIGYRMVCDGEQLALVDFGTFFETLRKDPKGTGDARWFVQAAHFYVGLERKKDFRMVRMRMLKVFLTDLMEVLQPGRIDRSQVETALELFASIERETGGPNWAPKGVDSGAIKRRLQYASTSHEANRFMIFLQKLKS
ncbi:MAG TPA: hypothetical protein VI168_18100 [Croceibacterium sp.]